MAENFLRTLKFPGIANPYVIPEAFTATDDGEGNISFESYPGQAGSGGSGDSVRLDDTLTKAGYAAESKAVGEAIRALGVKNIIIYNNTANLPTVVEGAILIAYDN